MVRRIQETLSLGHDDGGFRESKAIRKHDPAQKKPRRIFPPWSSCCAIPALKMAQKGYALSDTIAQYKR